MPATLTLPSCHTWAEELGKSPSSEIQVSMFLRNKPMQDMIKSSWNGKTFLGSAKLIYKRGAAVVWVIGLELSSLFKPEQNPTCQ